ncbi:hypothetical protein EVAR_79575_1 [Eumeta japonica]|uniref:Uncharacterized protein n=1 Tax=Eumeta variegata TaxID=151549 RepID=A0A4C1UED0_EUMVA|nr:hypothetical protein EVAR_79575_1 [Eumeta japonica]
MDVLNAFKVSMSAVECTIHRLSGERVVGATSRNVIPVIRRAHVDMYVLEWSTRGAAGTHQEQTEKIIVLPGLAILAPLKVYALCPGTSGTALFTALFRQFF